MSEEEELLSKSVPENALRIDPQNRNYTVPRSYGVYEILSITNTKRFRLGNHPVRENELVREFENVKRVGLYYDRKEAKTLADLLNNYDL